MPGDAGPVETEIMGPGELVPVDVGGTEPHMKKQSRRYADTFPRTNGATTASPKAAKRRTSSGRKSRMVAITL